MPDSVSPQSLLLTAVDMMKLEKIEFGGIRGKGLSQQVQWLHEDFLERLKVLVEKPYDCLDVNNKVEFQWNIQISTSQDKAKKTFSQWVVILRY